MHKPEAGSFAIDLEKSDEKMAMLRRKWRADKLHRNGELWSTSLRCGWAMSTSSLLQLTLSERSKGSSKRTATAVIEVG